MRHRGVSRRSAPTTSGRTGSSAAASSSRTSTRVSTSPTRPSSTSTRATSAARSTTTTPGGTRPGSAGTSPATTRSTEHTRWARWSVATGPALHAGRGRGARRQVDRREGMRGLLLHRDLAALRRGVRPRADGPRRSESRSSKRPDIVNNSWGGGPADEFYLEVVQAWRAAGIIPVFSAGNAGPQCETGGSPGDFLESFSVGATDVGDDIAEFSSRGPSPFGKVNPDVSAPGVDVVSSVPGDGYDSFSGTSMAAPHTAGTLALLLSAEPGCWATSKARPTPSARRRTVSSTTDAAATRTVIRQRLRRRSDRRAGGRVARGHRRDPRGRRHRRRDDRPDRRRDDRGSAGGRTFGATTDDAGHFELFLAAGTYTVTASAFAYRPPSPPGSDRNGSTTSQDFFLAPLPQRDITGTITAEEDGTPIEGPR